MQVAFIDDEYHYVAEDEENWSVIHPHWVTILEMKYIPKIGDSFLFDIKDMPKSMVKELAAAHGEKYSNIGYNRVEGIISDVNHYIHNGNHYILAYTSFSYGDEKE